MSSHSLTDDAAQGTAEFDHSDFGQPGGGCAAAAAELQTDQDQDGIADAIDYCLGTPAGVAVDSRGCPLRCFLHFQVMFDMDAGEIAPAQQDRLQQLADLLRDNPQLDVVLEGHSDNMGDSQRNLQRSRQRAEQVQAVLVDRYGVAAHRLHLRAFGSSRPLVTNNTLVGRARNQRVEASVQGLYAAHGGWLALNRPYNVLFGIGTVTLDALARLRLDDLGRHMQADTDVVAMLEGHSDAMGDRQSHLAVSRLRAEAVREYLMQRWGIAPQRLAVAALGDAVPLAEHASLHGRALNHRVSVRLHRGWSPEAVLAKAKALEEHARDPAGVWRDRHASLVAVQGQASVVEFSQGETVPAPEMQRRLESIAAYLVQRPELRVIVLGHCDVLGDMQQEQALALMRAEAVRQLLEQHCQIAPARLEVRSYGAQMPVASNETAEGRQRNRRVELRILPPLP
ncbi:OmpA family protein [Megalodesulfovibrio gigas]|nr:OmpA family protein [Megalodesulfovibrio gigas]